MYKFISDNALLENMYLFISAFKEYNITPIFVFDGKPPPEKKALLNRRYLEKKEAENKYAEIQKLISDDLTDQQKEDALKEMEALKKQFIRVREDDVKQVKALMDSFGMAYYDAPGEADEVCAKLSLSGKAWGCLSDDMDMFLYGCPFVLRGLNLLKQSVIIYDTESILNELEMSADDFREILVISGTDYNIHSGTNLHETIQWFNEYNKYRHNKSKSKQVGFYVWLLKNTKYIRDYRELIKTYLLFKLPVLKGDEYDISYNSNTMNIDEIRNIMEKEGFIFVKPIVS
jgi:5'-3' exonuclease